MGRAFEKCASWTRPYSGTAAPLRVLLLVSARGGDVVAHPFLDDRIVQTTVFVVEGSRDGMMLPPHDVVFNSIGDADRCREPLERARALCDASPAATINDPERVLATGRAANAERLASIPGVAIPRTERFVRSTIAAAELAASGWTFPLLVRAPGYHAGTYFEQCAEPAGLRKVLANVPGDPLFLIQFLDIRAADGFVRKYRVLFVGGRIYAAHLAISRDWKVHYFSSDMAERADHRDEERRFLNDMQATLGGAVIATLERIERILGLDYGGVDFGLDAAGNVVVFEANATMAVYPPAAQERWAYRQSAYQAIVAAVRALIASRSTVRKRPINSLDQGA
jgi:glutathione synthase/RimK-type ligase-like ATP-grasp enzyme